MNSSSLQWIWKILRPLEEADVLVRREIPFYARRRHWMIAAPEGIQSISVGLLGFFVFALNGTPGNILGVLLLVLAAGSLIHMGTNKDSMLSLVGLGASTFLGFALLDVRGAGLFALFWSIQRFLGAFITWRFYDRLYITDRRVIGSRGILQSRIDTLPLSRATDISYNRTFLGELLGYATLRIETAGQDQALSTIKFIEDPEIFYELLILQSVGTADVA